MTSQEILTRLGIDQLNAMQQETMLQYRRTRSLVLLSPTGSGKTLAYLLPLIESLDAGSDRVQAAVLVPSRELALQTSEVVRQAGNPVRCVAVYGGRPAMDEHRTIRGTMPQLVVGTPGRMLDHLRKENIDATHIRTLVIDEFDKCLELGFQEEMADVLALLPQVEKRVLLSATRPSPLPVPPRGAGVVTLNYRKLYNPEEFIQLDFLASQEDVGNHALPSGRDGEGAALEQFLVKSPVKDKLDTLGHLLCTRGQERSIVFVGFRESVQRIHDYLRREGFESVAFHGGMEQKDRERALFRFSSGCANILVSTDLASRGLDIPEVDNVIHYHLPLDQQSLTHRNGRTARWDKTGRAFFIVAPSPTPPHNGRGVVTAPYETTPALPKDLPEYILPSHQGEGLGVGLPLWDTLYIGKGKKDKISRGDIAGFLMKTGGLPKDSVGRIDVRDHYAYVAIARERVSETLARVRGQKIKGIKTIIERIR